MIAPDLEPAKLCLTLVHEAAHELMHFDEERRKSTTKTVRETKAEAVAHVVCQALGLDSIEHSADYIQLYNGDADVLTQSMVHIQKTAAGILEGIQSFTVDANAESEEVAA